MKKKFVVYSLTNEPLSHFGKGLSKVNGLCEGSSKTVVPNKSFHPGSSANVEKKHNESTAHRSKSIIVDIIIIKVNTHYLSGIVADNIYSQSIMVV